MVLIILSADVFYWLGHEKAFKVPGLGNIFVAVLATGLIYFICHLILKHHKFGQELYAIGVTEMQLKH